jgi:hypothetical protein
MLFKNNATRRNILVTSFQDKAYPNIVMGGSLALIYFIAQHLYRALVYI